MGDDTWSGTELVLSVVGAAANLERVMGGSLATIKGISLSEFRLLSSIAAAPGQRASRADLARTVGVSPSAVTRALRPLEALGLTETIKNPRDARLALAMLTPQGEDLLSDAVGVLDDALPSVLERSPTVAENRPALTSMLGELSNL